MFNRIKDTARSRFFSTLEGGAIATAALAPNDLVQLEGALAAIALFAIDALFSFFSNKGNK